MARPALYGENMARITLHLPQPVIDQLTEEGRMQQRPMADAARLMLQTALQQKNIEDLQQLDRGQRLQEAYKRGRRISAQT